MITHVLRDGTQLNSIAGHVVKVKDFENVYQIIGRIESRGKDAKGADRCKDGV